MTPTEFIAALIAGGMIGFGIGIWFALKVRDKKK